jgi:hypothetical protein
MGGSYDHIEAQSLHKTCQVAYPHIEAQSWHEKLSTVPAYGILNQGSRVWSCP